MRLNDGDKVVSLALVDKVKEDDEEAPEAKTPKPAKLRSDFWGGEQPIAIAHRGGAGVYAFDRFQQRKYPQDI